MQIIDYFKAENQAHWLAQIASYEWRAAKHLAGLLEKGEFHLKVGEGTLYLLTDGDKLVSFVSLARCDYLDAPYGPWIGFVYTAQEYRGHRYVGKLIDHACRIAGEHGVQRVYINTDHVGLYEKYGFTYVENRANAFGEDSRIYVRETVQIKQLTRENFSDHSLDEFIRRQEVTESWRCKEGDWKLVPTVFVNDWEPSVRRWKAGEILKSIDQGYPGFGAFVGDAVIGFAALGERLGSRQQYMELWNFHVSAPYRGQGIGRRLFAAICDAARAAGADKLYISAQSAKETQAAYKALGCVHAQEIDPTRAAEKPCDVQLEYDMRPLSIRFGVEDDLPSWMALVRRVAWNFPGLETVKGIQTHAATVAKFIGKDDAICALRGREVVGVLLFSRRLNMLCCMAVAPEVRRQGVAQRMFNLMLTIADPTRSLTVTTFREGDSKGDAPRAFYIKNGFIPAELVVENGYPCQVFVRKRMFRVVELTEELLPALFAFEQRLSEEEPGFYRWTEEADYQAKVCASFHDPRYDNALSFVAIADTGEIVGRIDASLIPTHFDGSLKGYLDWICVLKSWRHKGVAQALMDALRRALKAREIDTLVGLIAANDEAQRFYRSMQGALIRDEGIWIDC